MTEYFLFGLFAGITIGYGLGHHQADKEPFFIDRVEYIFKSDKYARLKNGLLTLALETVYKDKVGTELPIINTVKGYLLSDSYEDIDRFLEKYINTSDKENNLFIKYYIQTMVCGVSESNNGESIDLPSGYDCCET